MTTRLAHPRGGLYSEDFSAGLVFRHRLTRTVTQMDNMLFSNMTLNPSRFRSTLTSARPRPNGVGR